MHELNVTDAEIEDAEAMLLPKGCHFGEEARSVIRTWTSTDVVACPGSGKTTVLLAKLKLLVDSMPLESGGGVCVLSHTNVAVDEIGKRLPQYSSRLLGYPNFVGTIQSFVDRFLVTPYLRWRYGVSAHPVDNEAYGRAVLGMLRAEGHSELANLARSRCMGSGGYRDVAEYVGGFLLDDEGALRDGGGNRLAGAGVPSASQFLWATNRLLTRDGTIRYGDAYRYAARAIDEHLDILPVLLSARFAYVFVDEYQDCNQVQRDVLGRVFDRDVCCVMHIGDPDQAIYSSDKEKTSDWEAAPGFPAIGISNRYGQRIADVLTPLRKGSERITSSVGAGIHPVLIVCDENTIKDVPACFAQVIHDKGLGESEGEFKAIGFVGKENTKGTSIGDYWDGYHKTRGKRTRLGYWDMVEEISNALSEGAVHRAEPIVRDLLCKILRLSGCSTLGDTKRLNVASLKELLSDEYRLRVLDMATSADLSPDAVSYAVHGLLEEAIGARPARDALGRLPGYFMERNRDDSAEAPNRNVYIDPKFGTRISFDTVHGVKGETHEATLYLETVRNRASDVSRVLQHYGAGKKGSKPIHDYCRKVVYVGMSRPKKLLCLAIKSKTYEEGKKAFHDWEVIDLRQANGS